MLSWKNPFSRGIEAMVRILLLTALTLLSIRTASAQHVAVQIDAGRVVRPVNPWLYGINTARWDESLFPGPTNEMLLTCDRDAIAKIKTSGVTVLKYPGGNDADSYVWNSPVNNASEMDTDEYIALCRETGAEPFITINFNEPPGLAAAWVNYCNTERGYNVKLWEVGDEQWGWWAKGHLPPEEYAKKYLAFVRSMKAVDPTIKVATNVSLGPHPENWTERVLRAAGEDIDMLTVTFFPQQWGKENDDSLLASTATFRAQFLQLRREVERVAGEAKADSILFVNVGYNSVNHSPGPQTLLIVNALWVADMIGTMAEVGVDIGCYWALHNYYPPRKGDYGYLSSDRTNTPWYNYFVFPMYANHFGGTVVQSGSDDPDVSVYAATSGKRLSVFLINRDSANAKNVGVQVRNFNSRDRARVWILDETHRYEQLPDIPVQGNAIAVMLPPYSLQAVDLIGADSVIPPPNIARTATATASSHSVIGPTFGPSSAIDGRWYTRWNSAAWTKSDGKEAQWFQLGWPTPRRFTRVRILWGESHAEEYALEVSDDGTEWRELRNVPRGSGGVEEFEFDPVTARYLRMNGRRGTGGRSTISAYSIREMEVYDTLDTAQ
jgi:F5/8 type C domain